MKNLGVILIILFMIGGSAKVNAQKSVTEFDKNFTHVVYFWLNNPDSEEDRKAFLKSLNNFMENSEYAGTKFIGEPAMTPRDVVDNSYTYSLILSFPSKEIQDKYQNEKAHKQFVKESENLWKKVQVYDSVGIK